MLSSMQKKLQDMNKKKESARYKGSTGGGALTITINGDFYIIPSCIFSFSCLHKVAVYLTKKILQDWHLKQSRRNLCGTKKYRRFEHINSFIRAAIIGKAAFLDPDTDIEPYSFAPPTEKILAISVKYCWKVIYRIFGNVISFWTKASK